VPTSHWAKVSFLVAVEAPFTGIRFRLVKRGPGRAVLADIGAEIADGCPGAPVVSMPPAPLTAASADHGTVDGAGARP
jgi:hypothetical protein